MEKQKEQIKNICLLREEGLALYLVKEGDKFTDIKNGSFSILPEELIAKCKNGEDISAVYEKFLNKITKRKSFIARVKLFTLNYDTLFEQAARKGN